MNNLLEHLKKSVVVRLNDGL